MYPRPSSIRKPARSARCCWTAARASRPTCTSTAAVVRALLSSALGLAVEDWSEWLPCDRMQTLRCAPDEALPPYSEACADAAGWLSNVPLQHGTVKSFVYCSEFIDDESAAARLLAAAGTQARGAPRLQRLLRGRPRGILGAQLPAAAGRCARSARKRRPASGADRHHAVSRALSRARRQPVRSRRIQPPDRRGIRPPPRSHGAALSRDDAQRFPVLESPPGRGRAGNAGAPARVVCRQRPCDRR